MVSKEQYYARKAAGLCTKCGNPLGDSPSKARCLECHSKLKKSLGEAKQPTATKQQEEAEKNVEEAEKPVKATKPAQVIAEELKKNKQIDINQNYKFCQKCGDEISSLNIICQPCLKKNVFSREDAIARYGGNCKLCGRANIEDLRIVSADIGKSMEHKDQTLFKLICYRRVPPGQYKVSCHTCYWKENLSYIRQLKQLFDQKGAILDQDEEDSEDSEDIIDI